MQARYLGTVSKVPEGLRGRGNRVERSRLNQNQTLEYTTLYHIPPVEAGTLFCGGFKVPS